MTTAAVWTAAEDLLPAFWGREWWLVLDQDFQILVSILNTLQVNDERA